MDRQTTRFVKNECSDFYASTFTSKSILQLWKLNECRFFLPVLFVLKLSQSLDFTQAFKKVKSNRSMMQERERAAFLRMVIDVGRNRLRNKERPRGVGLCGT